MTTVFFIPGIMGSTLVRPTDKKVVWSLDLDRLFDVLATNPAALEGHLTPGEVIRFARMEALLGLYRQDVPVYSGILDYLNANFKSVHAVAYDWRRSIEDSSLAVAERIEKEGRKSSCIHVVAHSMGGLVGGLAVSKLQGTPTGGKIDKLITLGTPFQGSARAFKTLSTGMPEIHELLDGILKRKRKEFVAAAAQLKDALSRMESIYQLLPSKDECFLSRGGEILSAFDERVTWPLSASDRLEKASRVHDSLKSSVIPGLHTIFSNSIQTDFHYEVNERFEIVRTKFDSGDGTVCVKSSQGPQGQSIRIPLNEGPSHQKLPLDKQVHGHLSNLLLS